MSYLQRLWRCDHGTIQIPTIIIIITGTQFLPVQFNLGKNCISTAGLYSHGIKFEMHSTSELKWKGVRIKTTSFYLRYMYVDYRQLRGRFTIEIINSLQEHNS